MGLGDEKEVQEVLGCKFPMIRNRVTGVVIKGRYDESHMEPGIRRTYVPQFDNVLPRIDKINKEHLVQQKDVLQRSEWQLIPCGKCTECRLQYSREWANRCLLESLAYTSNWFVTLTYNPESIPTLRTDTGEIYRGGVQEIRNNKILVSNTLFHDDIQKFLKRLRRQLEYKNEPEIRYYMCGEYGSTTQRPHYHMIIYNLSVPDIEFYKLNELHQPLFQSEWLENLWGYGFVTLGEVNWNTCAYVARYIMKKVKGADAKEHYKKIGKTPEYTRMSLRPGIGMEYYQLNKDQIYKFDQIILPGKQAKKVQPSKYFDKLYDIDNPERMQEIKAAREKKARLTQQLKLSKTTLDLWEQLKIEHEAKQDAYKKLIRPLE